MTGERPGTSDLGQNYRNYSRTIFVPGLMRIHDIQHQFQDPGHVWTIIFSKTRQNRQCPGAEGTSMTVA